MGLNILVEKLQICRILIEIEIEMNMLKNHNKGLRLDIIIGNKGVL